MAYRTEEGKAERTAEFGATFGSADTNQDGLLDRAEWDDFMSKLAANSAARDVPWPNDEAYPQELKDAVFELFNATTAGTEGISAADYHSTMGALMVKMLELSQ